MDDRKPAELRRGGTNFLGLVANPALHGLRHGTKEPLDLIATPLDDHANAAISQITHRSAHGKSGCDLAGRVAKTDALNVASKMDRSPFVLFACHGFATGSLFLFVASKGSRQWAHFPLLRV